MASATKSLLLLALAIATMLMGSRISKAEDYVLGFTNFETCCYESWATRNHFKIGDNIVFNYMPDDIVLQVTRQNYDACNFTSPYAAWTNDGQFIFNIKEHGHFYFISGVADGSCENGEKVRVPVPEHDGPGLAPSPSAPGSEAAPTPASEQSPSLSSGSSLYFLFGRFGLPY